MKVTIVMGNTPADCSLEIDGEKILNAVRIEAHVDIDTGPVVSYNVPNLNTGGEDTVEVPFDDLVIDERGTPIVVTDNGIIVKGNK